MGYIRAPPNPPDVARGTVMGRLAVVLLLLPMLYFCCRFA
jgi:hypothetical protein